MVRSAILKILGGEWRPIEGGWVRLAQLFVGLFFLSSAFFKLMSYFIIGDQTLAGHFQFWMDSGFMPDWYAVIVRGFLQPHWKPIAVLVILLQGIAGFLIMTNTLGQWGAFALLFVQTAIFFALLQHQSFNEFVGISLWIALYYLLRPRDPTVIPQARWEVLTLLLVVLCAVMVRNRITYEDPWLASFVYQREHFAADILPASLTWKHLILSLTAWEGSRYLWVGTWWLRLSLTLGLLTRWRLYAGLGHLLLWVGTTITWTNSVTSHGVLWVLTLFVWVTQEQLLTQRRGVAAAPPPPALPASPAPGFL